MSKPVTEVDRNKLAQSIREAENKEKFANRSKLWPVVADIYNKKNPPTKISQSVVMLRAIEWKLPLETPKGKKGRAAGVTLSAEQKAAMQAGRGKRSGRGEKFKSPAAQAIIQKLREVTPERFLPLVDAVERGSRTAANKLKCLDCSGYQTSEVRHCTVLTCSEWLFRPYQGSLKPGEIPVDKGVAIEEEEIEEDDDDELEDGP